MTTDSVPSNAATTNAPLRSSLASESLLFANRLFTHWRREPVVAIQALLYPSFLLITYYFLVAKSMMNVTGKDTLYGLVPTCAIAGAVLGALAASSTLHMERDHGLLSRFWVLPVHRASALTGRLLADATRTLAGTVVITAVGAGLGLRFNGSLFAVIPFMLVPVAVGVVFSTAMIAIAVRSADNKLLIWLGVPAIAMVFASSGAPPIEMMPSWVQPLIRFQPMWAAVDSMRALAEGRPALSSLLVTLAWGVGLAAVVVPVAIRGYRTAAESGTLA
ncbi:ABC transporter permease [Mycolicibacterium sphagni]|uniref:ABC transporter permease n=1 Tax=Mycolicibacterium sphagni TaxID=1786 RepID=UPI0015766DE0|nr:ABC transporter permease [Mycolicibacterium sphagni]